MNKKDRQEVESESRFTAENRECKQLVSVNGTAVTHSGKLTKTNYFRWIDYDLDQYDQIEMSPDEAKRINSHLRKLSTGTTATVPLYCGGPSCPFGSTCPLQRMDKAPIGRQCLIEVQLIKEFLIRYFEEFDIDPNNFTEIGYINELAELMILEMRLNRVIARSENAELIIDQVVSIGQDGTPIIQKQISPYMEQKEKLQNRRSKIIKLMVGDRQEKYKKEAALKIKMDADPSSKMAKMRTQLENLQRQLDSFSSTTPGENQQQINDLGHLSPQDIIDAADDDE